jgi:exonuclease III
MHVPSEEKSYDLKDNFYEETEQVFCQFPKYHMKILLGDINTKVEREDIFKPTIEYEILQHDSNGNGVRIVNFAASST